MRRTAIEIGVERAMRLTMPVLELSGAAPAWRLHEQGEQRASKRAQTALRDIAVRRWDSAMCRNCIML